MTGSNPTYLCIKRGNALLVNIVSLDAFLWRGAILFPSIKSHSTATVITSLLTAVRSQLRKNSLSATMTYVLRPCCRYYYYYCCPLYPLNYFSMSIFFIIFSFALIMSFFQPTQCQPVLDQNEVTFLEQNFCTHPVTVIEQKNTLSLHIVFNSTERGYPKE